MLSIFQHLFFFVLFSFYNLICCHDLFKRVKLDYSHTFHKGYLAVTLGELYAYPSQRVAHCLSVTTPPGYLVSGQIMKSLVAKGAKSIFDQI